MRTVISEFDMKDVAYTSLCKHVRGSVCYRVKNEVDGALYWRGRGSRMWFDEAARDDLARRPRA